MLAQSGARVTFRAEGQASCAATSLPCHPLFMQSERRSAAPGAGSAQGYARSSLDNKQATGELSEAAQAEYVAYVAFLAGKG
jgi:hypothetical protein